jgi:arylamine N-acetyltransferase
MTRVFEKDQITNIFLERFRIHPESSPDHLMESVVRVFSQLPYENLTKIIKKEIEGNAQRSRREPHEVLQDHFDFGTGGTCFSLTQTLLHLLRSLGWNAEPILADRRYGINTHCALLVWIHDEPHLIDPGYLILKPLPLIKRDEMKVQTAFNELTLSPQAEGSKLNLCTVEKGRSTYRLTYKLDPVDHEEFFKVWDDSFNWNMMTYPLLTRVIGEEQIYIRGTRFQSRCLDFVEKNEIDPEKLIERISIQFGIDPSVVAKALSILKQKGEYFG